MQQTSYKTLLSLKTMPKLKLLLSFESSRRSKLTHLGKPAELHDTKDEPASLAPCYTTRNVIVCVLVVFIEMPHIPSQSLKIRALLDYVKFGSTTN